MHAQVEMMLSSYKISVEMAKRMANDPSQIQGLLDVYDEVLQLADDVGDDFMAFVNKANETNLFTRLTGEIAKANTNVQEQNEDPETRKMLGMEDIIAQYKMLRDMVAKKPFMYETLKAYDELLAVGNETDSLTEFQAAIYKRGLVHKVGFMSFYDSDKLHYDKTEPNQIHEKALYKKMMEIALDAESSDELSYRMLITANNTSRTIYKDDYIFGHISDLFMYLRMFAVIRQKIRLGFYMKTPDLLLAYRGIRPMIKDHYNMLKERLGVDWDTIVNTPRYVKRLLMFRRPLHDSQRLFFLEDPSNLDFFKEILFEAVFSDMTLMELLYHIPKNRRAVRPLNEHTKQFNLYQMLTDIAKERAKKYYWTDYDIEVLDKGMENYYEILEKTVEEKKKRIKNMESEAKSVTLKDNLKTNLMDNLKQRMRF